MAAAAIVPGTAFAQSASPPRSVAPGPVASTAPLSNDATFDDRGLRIEAGVFGGIGIPLSGLTVGPAVGLEAGVRRGLGSGDTFVSFRGSYERHTMDGTGTLACDGTVPTQPCVRPDMGRYRYALVEQDVSLSLLLGYRLFPWTARIAPYAAFFPTFVMQRVESTVYELTNVETANNFSLGGLLGAQLRLGPGALFLEVSARYAPIRTLQTGPGALSVIQTWIGYRLGF